MRMATSSSDVVSDWKKRKRFSFKYSWKISNILVKQFQAMTLHEKDDSFLPIKKRKISENVWKTSSDACRSMDYFLKESRFNLDREDESMDYTTNEIIPVKQNNTPETNERTCLTHKTSKEDQGISQVNHPSLKDESLRLYTDEYENFQKVKYREHVESFINMDISKKTIHFQRAENNSLGFSRKLDVEVYKDDSLKERSQNSVFSKAVGFFSSVAGLSDSGCIDPGLKIKRMQAKYTSKSSDSHRRDEIESDSAIQTSSNEHTGVQKHSFRHWRYYSKKLVRNVNLENFKPVCYKFFDSRVMFVLPRDRRGSIDFEAIVRRFGEFGKVSSIQDHWVKPKGSMNMFPSVWAGASVTYKHRTDCERALKACSTNNSSVICISLISHLERIHKLESAWSAMSPHSSKGTCILVGGIAVRSMKMREELSKYGQIGCIKWNAVNESQKECEVTYKSTVSAVAAALDLDGKNLLKTHHLRTKIKITAKELFIHRKLRETF